MMQLPFCIIFLPYSDSLSILCLMYRQLRERETDSFLVEYSINGLVHIKINSPVITALHPNTDNYVHAAGIQSMQGHKRFRSIQYAAVCRKCTVLSTLS